MYRSLLYADGERDKGGYGEHEGELRNAKPATVTGDSSHLLLWIVLSLTSCMGIVVITVSVRKRIVK